MKLHKTRRMFCSWCKTHTIHKIIQVKGRERSALKRGSIQRAALRGRGIGFGNKGKWGSKPAISKWKRTGKKASKKTNLQFQCEVCKKTIGQKQGFRTKKLEIQ